LDTKAAELSAQAKFSGYARGAPWAAVGNGKPLGVGHFAPDAACDVIGQIARFAVENAVDAVLSPSHFLAKGSKTDWFAFDCRACSALRRALDRLGGRHIAIDHQLVVPHVILDDVGERGTMVEALKDLDFDNLWLRASGFGSDAGPLSTRRYNNSLCALHNLGRPIVADYLGGLISLAAETFGAISGFAEGIGERERFNARDWHNAPAPRDDDQPYGPTKRVMISGFGRSVTVGELMQLSEAKGGRRLVACGDRSCCPHGLDDMLKNPKRHTINQRLQQVREMEKVPDLNRAQHFLDGEMSRADRLARQIKELKVDERLRSRLSSYSRRMEKLRAALEHFHETRGNDVPRALPIIERKNMAERLGTDRA
jgi:hypothetical protein